MLIGIVIIIRHYPHRSLVKRYWEKRLVTV